MKCCASCFGDRGLRKEISYRSTQTGTCEYCGTAAEALIEPRELADKFAALVNVYEPDPSGKLLVQWFKEDWALFKHPRMDDAHAQVLLGEILDDGEMARRLFIPSARYASDRLGLWERFRQELLHENRFFPKTEIDLNRLESLLSQLVLDHGEVPNIWYRARIQSGDTAFSTNEMQAPPSKLASHGRANPAGIPYLYLASTIVTCISEVRPHTGEIACVAEFTTGNDLELVDLRSPRATISPFILTDNEAGQMRYDLTFLERLGRELTRPVRPQAAAFDYTPSQYLCEFIKKCGYDGVVYSSSVSDGINLALFNPQNATISEITQHSVSRVSVDVTCMS